MSFQDKFLKSESLYWENYNIFSSSNNGGDIALFAAGSGGQRRIDKFLISTISNGTFVGNLANSRYENGAGSNKSIGLFAGGYPSTSYNKIDKVTFAILNDSTEFGTLNFPRYDSSACSSGINLYSWFGADTSVKNVEKISFMTGATSINLATFSDYVSKLAASGSNTVRGVNAGGYKSSGYTKEIRYMDFSNESTISLFGNLIAWSSYFATVCSDSRCCFTWIQNVNRINYITFATLANANDFGAISVGAHAAGCSNSVSGLCYGSGAAGGVYKININILSDASFFGNLSVARLYTSAASGV